MAEVKRKYSSTHREVLAVRTREQILESARRLFGEQGFASTTIDQIAKAAGVASPTVYATFGGKRAILMQLLDRLEQAADVASLQSVLAQQAGNEYEQLDAFIAFCVRFFTEGSDLMQIVERSGMGDPDIAEFTRVGKERALASCRQLLKGWRKRGVLRKGLTEERAADILWAISNTELYSLLVRGRNWSLKQYQEWLSGMAARELLRGPAR
jgi:AcrR family transcriptional regulator